MNLNAIGLDIAKSVFQAHGVDDSGHAVLRKRLSRVDLLAVFSKLPPWLIGIEACSGAHRWARKLAQPGQDARLIPARYRSPM